MPEVPPSGRQTRVTIWPQDSRNGLAAPELPARSSLVSEPTRLALLGLAALELVVVGDDDLRLAEVATRSVGDEVAQLVVVLVVLGEQDAEPVADRQAGGDDEEPVGEARVVRAGRTLFSVCQAMSIAITTVLPEPVAILSAIAVQAEVVTRRWSRRAGCGSRRRPASGPPRPGRSRSRPPRAGRTGSGCRGSGSDQYSRSRRVVGVTLG